MDRSLKVAYGSGRHALKWANKTITFDELCDRLKTPVRTPETAEEYPRLPKEERDSIKDKGGLVGGHLREGRRKADNVICRSMGSHDIDEPDEGFLKRFRENHRFAAVLYSTHGHRPEAPRYRIFTPFTRDVTPDEYVAIMRWLAQEIGIECVDRCSYQVHQLMYWPTVPSNGEYICERFDGDWLDPDAFLAEHPGWKDIATLPTSSKESTLVKRDLKRQQDPLTKTGVIGAFNNAFFPIQRLLETELADVYEPTADEHRYTHIGSSGTAGAVIYDDRFLYSNHATDPAYGKLLNAFDLLRVHRWGDLDDKAAMQEALSFASSLPEVRDILNTQRRDRMREEFETAASEENEDSDWEKRLLEYHRRTGELLPTLRNAVAIMTHDRHLKNMVFNQLADGIEIQGELPWNHPNRFWRDADDAQLDVYIELRYGHISTGVLSTAVTKVTDDRSYHPVKDMLNSLPAWDGIKRLDTLYIDYLGADDTPYTRAVTRKPFVAAIRRVKHPGIKFDYMTVLQGAQGIGKSTVIAKMGGGYFSDSLSLSDMNDKTAAEKLQGYWIMEIGELAGMRKADIDKVKAFISRQDDKYRASYGRRVTPHPRQCVFFGTTNSEKGFLRDITGNRRFWVVRVPGHGRLRPWDMSPETVQQLWAEAMVYEENGEPLYLEPELEAKAALYQREAMEQDDREGMVQAYLDTLLPDDWDKKDLGARRDYLDGLSLAHEVWGSVRRQTVSNLEIWCECFGKRQEDIQAKDSYAIAAIMERLPDWERTDERMRLPIYGQQRVYRRVRHT